MIILGGLELLKRDVFDKFSIQSLKNNTILKQVLPLTLMSLLLISGSFYSSISGAKEFSSKTKQIEVEVNSDIDTFSDSLNLFYGDKIVIIESQNQSLFDSNNDLDDEARELPPNWISAKNSIRERIDINNEQIEKNDIKISNLKLERDSEISEYEKDVLLDSGGEKEENSKNSFIFIIISTLIELVILGGVYFSEYYKFRSYKEFGDKISKDPNYQKWMLYDDLLSVIIPVDAKANQKIQSYKSIIDICKVNDIFLTQKDIVTFMKILNSLNIIRSSGSAKYIMKNREEASEILKDKFNIE